jgi:type I restriction enzyme S subunit
MSSKEEADDMTADSKPALVPERRFPEFRKSLAWEMKPLSAGLDYLQPTPYLVSDTSYNPVYKTPVLTAGKTFILGYTNEEHGIFRDGLPVIIFDDFTTASQFVDFPFKAKSSAMKILQAKNGSNIKFMFEALQMLSFEVGAHERHWISVFAPMLVAVPKPCEQQKIAECLSSVDEAIAAQASKVDGLKKYKKGLMQQLFPHEGETQPRLRFPEFQNAGAWAKTTLRMICQRIMDGTHFSPRTKEGPRPYLTSKNIRMGWLDLSTITFIAEDEHRSIYARCPVKKNDVLLTKDGANTGNCAINTIDEEFSLLSSVAVLRGDPEQIIQQFLYQSIASDGMQSRIVNSMSGQAITRITLEKLGNYEILIPNISEQQYIADLLSSLDTLFIAETQKLEALKTHKRGLMQQLFPSPKEAEK